MRGGHKNANEKDLDDTYVADAPRPALEAMLEGDALAQKWSGVESNVSKRQIWAPDPASLEAVRDYPSVRGTPAAPPDGKYAGGTLRGIRVLGAYLGDDEWRKTELVARVERALKPLEGILKLRDTKEIHTAQQVMQVLLRFCSNTTLTFFLRAMPPSVTPIDDTYVAPRPALEAMLEGDDLARRWSGVESNVSKRQIWAPDPAAVFVTFTSRSLSVLFKSLSVISVF